jgi:hypothetical protein
MEENILTSSTKQMMLARMEHIVDRMLMANDDAMLQERELVLYLANSSVIVFNEEVFGRLHDKMPAEGFAILIDQDMRHHYTKLVKLYIVGDQKSRLLQTESGKRFLCNDTWKMDKDKQLWTDFCNRGNELYVQALSKTLVLWSIRNGDRRLEFDLVGEGD